MKLDIEPLTPDRWGDLEAIFNARGCAVARNCWCMYYRQSGSNAPPPGKKLSQVRRIQFKALVRSGPPPGLIGYRGNVPVGWVALGPRENYKRFERSVTLKPLGDEAVWSVICFVVPAEYRGQGIARALLEGAVKYAKKHGSRLIEAYPVDRHDRTKDENMWFGTKSMFDDAGFKEVARRRPERPIVRLKTR